MIITAYSRDSIENANYRLLKEASVDHILISITSQEPVNLKYAKACPYCKDILVKIFDDVDNKWLKIYKEKIITDFRIFSENDTKELLDFVEKRIVNISSIIVNCDYGVSRSQAVAASLSKILNDKDDEYFRKYYPNRLVYSKILHEYYINEDKYPNMDEYHNKNCVRL